MGTAAGTLESPDPDVGPVAAASFGVGHSALVGTSSGDGLARNSRGGAFGVPAAALRRASAASAAIVPFVAGGGIAAVD